MADSFCAGDCISSLRYDLIFPVLGISFCWWWFGGGLVKESYR
jgi:hypothetical protein